MDEDIESVGENVPDAPTEKQLAAIRNPAKTTKSSVNLNKVMNSTSDILSIRPELCRLGAFSLW